MMCARQDMCGYKHVRVEGEYYCIYVRRRTAKPSVFVPTNERTNSARTTLWQRLCVPHEDKSAARISLRSAKLGTEIISDYRFLL